MENQKGLQVKKRYQFLFREMNLKYFTIRWFDGIKRTMEALFRANNMDTSEEKPYELPPSGLVTPKKKSGKKPARIVSRSDLSQTNPNREALYKDKSFTFNNKGFYGTPLPLIPDIRKSEVSEGIVGTLLEAFGVAKRFDRQVTLSQGPNKRANRYLVYQYNRLIKSIDGTTVKGDIRITRPRSLNL